jgi:hypothetical protein
MSNSNRRRRHHQPPKAKPSPIKQKVEHLASLHGLQHHDGERFAYRIEQCPCGGLSVLLCDDCRNVITGFSLTGDPCEHATELVNDYGWHLL